MSKKFNTNEIANILEVIIEQSETIYTYPMGQIPQIELDIVRENIRKLYNSYAILNKINASLVDRLTEDIVKEHISMEQPAQFKEESAVVNQPIVQPELQEELPQTAQIETPTATIIEEAQPAIITEEAEKTEEIMAEITVEQPETINEHLETTIQEEVIEEQIAEAKFVEEEIVEEKSTPIEVLDQPEEKVFNPQQSIFDEPIEKSVHSTPKTSKQPQSFGTLFGNETTSIADKYKMENKSLHEKIGGEKEDLSLASRLQQNAITDLIKSIGINDKFLFIKELFNNNGEEYNDAIQLLNNFSQVSQAFDYLDVLKNKYNWSESSNASLKLYDLIRRKYQ